jgi:hypothetical protein
MRTSANNDPILVCFFGIAKAVLVFDSKMLHKFFNLK